MKYRSIEKDMPSTRLRNFGSLFSGIGGFDLGFERAGMQCAWQVENDPFATRVLAKHWPNVPRWSDVREFLVPPAVDVVVGGFPCQPFSAAGKQRGADDDRYLWPEMLRVIDAVRPSWVVAENVLGLTSLFQYASVPPVEIDGTPVGQEGDICHRTGRGLLCSILDEIEHLYYQVATVALPACAFDAPHRRERVFLLARKRGPRVTLSDTLGEPLRDQWKRGGEQRELAGATIGRDNGEEGPVADTQGQPFRPGLCQDEPTEIGRGRLGDRSCEGYTWPPCTGVRRVANGVPRRMDRLRGLGNAVVPQVAEFIARLIIDAERETE